MSTKYVLRILCTDNLTEDVFACTKSVFKDFQSPACVSQDANSNERAVRIMLDLIRAQVVQSVLSGLSLYLMTEPNLEKGRL